MLSKTSVLSNVSVIFLPRKSKTKMSKSSTMPPRPGSTPSLSLSAIHPSPEQSPSFIRDSLVYPGTLNMNRGVGKLLLLSRSGGAETFRKGFETFRSKVTQPHLANQKELFRITTFYDTRIIPCGTRRATPRTMVPVDGNSSLELIFNHFCRSQEPGTGQHPTPRLRCHCYTG